VRKASCERAIVTVWVPLGTFLVRSFRLCPGRRAGLESKRITQPNHKEQRSQPSTTGSPHWDTPVADRQTAHCRHRRPGGANLACANCLTCHGIQAELWKAIALPDRTEGWSLPHMPATRHGTSTRLVQRHDFVTDTKRQNSSPRRVRHSGCFHHGDRQ